jgi:hypothetical protein
MVPVQFQPGALERRGDLADGSPGHGHYENPRAELVDMYQERRRSHHTPTRAESAIGNGRHSTADALCSEVSRDAASSGSTRQQREKIRAGMIESMKILDGSLTSSVAMLTGLSPERIAELGGVGEWDQ